MRRPSRHHHLAVEDSHLVTEPASTGFLALQQALAGRYSLVREIGRGGMGLVYLARDVALDRPVAIKLLPSEMAKDAELRERFLREARTAAQLSHPNIVPIHLVEERDGLVYFVMALIEGESLGERIRRAGPLRPAEAVRVIQEVAWALAYAHGRGVVHRDIKPDNILLERAAGRALVTDFGIARSTAAPALTSQGLILGTVHYMAPEQASAEGAIDGRADLYSLGVTAFYALTGRLPFPGDNVPALLAAHLLEPAPPLASVAAGVPAKLAEAVDRCLVKDPNARWPTGEALAEALSEVGRASHAMAPSIRAFVNAVKGGLMQIGLLVLVGMWANLMMPEQTATMIKVLLFVALSPLFGMVSAARALAIAGFTARDVGDAVAAEMGDSDRYVEHIRDQQRIAVRQLGSWWGRGALGVFGALEMVGGAIVLSGLFYRGLAWSQAPLLIFLGAPALWMGVELTGFALGIRPFRDRVINLFAHSHGRGQRLAARLWGSPPVRWLLAVARLGVKNRPAPVESSAQPTEVLLAKAAGDVFAALPAADRKALEGVPDLVRKLEGIAAKLRERKNGLEQAIAAVGEAGGASRRVQVAADLESERAATDQRLRATVEALENLRLDLLRLRAGVGSTDDLTEAIAAARRMGTDVNFALEGRAEVARIAPAT